MIEPIRLENKTLIIQSFDAKDLKQWSNMVNDVYALLSDNHALKYLPFKRLRTLNDADTLLKNALISLHCGRNYLHFIRKKTDGTIIGFIDVISPAVAKEHYTLKQYPYFIEFCIKTEYAQQKVMSTLLPDFLRSLRDQNINNIAAVINKQNIAAQKVLSRSGFNYYQFFDVDQDLYRFSEQQHCVA
jgi:ribosomal-protein-alanine N-acetyltransferase